MKVLYEDGSPELVIAETGTSAERGVAVEVPDDLGATLVKQGPWKAAKEAHSHKKDTKPPEAAEVKKEDD